MSPTLDRRRAILSLAGIGAASLGAATSVSAQATPSVETRPSSGGSGIVVTATGSASTASDHALVQIILRGQWPEMPMDDYTKPPAPAQFPIIAQEQVDAVVNALIESGVDASNLLTSEISSGYSGGFFGQGSAVIVFQLDGDAVKTLPDLLDIATAAATEAGILFDPPGAMYLAAGCEDLRSAAYRDAVEVGKEDAEMLADALGVELGALTRATKQSVFYGPAAYSFNQSDSCEDLVTLATALRTYLPQYDSSAPNEFAVYAMVELAFAIA